MVLLNQLNRCRINAKSSHSDLDEDIVFLKKKKKTLDLKMIKSAMRTSPGNLLDTQILRLHDRLSISEIIGVSPAIGLKHPPGDSNVC